MSTSSQFIHKNILKFIGLPLTFSSQPQTLSKTLLWTLEKYYNLPLYGSRLLVEEENNYSNKSIIRGGRGGGVDDIGGIINNTTSNNNRGGTWPHYAWKNYEEMFCQAQEFQIALNRNNIGVGDLVIICCPTSEEWVIADLACAMSAIVSIPLDPIVGTSKIQQICEKTNSKAILCVDTSLFEKVPSFSDAAGNNSVKIVKIGPLKKRTNFDANLLVDLSEKEDETHLFTLQPTSGSTGNVKLTKRTRSNWVKREGNRETILLVNALSSPSSRSWLWTNLMKGGKVAESSLETLISDCQIVHPTQFSAPPIVWDHISSIVRKGLIKPTASMEGTISWMSTLFGPNCVAVTNTGAGLSPATQQMMSSLFGSRFGDGYGSSETGGIAINGKLLPGVSIKLIDVPEMGYYSTDTPYPRGELYVKTTTMFDGYFKEDDQFEKKDDEWFPTGDIIELISPSEIRVIDRKSFTMKLKNGKFISSTSIENTLKSSALVQQVVVIVEQVSGKVIAAIVPNWELFTKFIQEKGIDNIQLSTKSEICSSERCRNELLKELKRIQISDGCNNNEILRGVLIKESLLSMKDGSLNPSMKVSKLELVSKLSKEFQSTINDESTSIDDEHDTNNTTQKYLNILKDVFGHEVSMSDHWTELGVNSLTVSLIINKLNSTFNCQLSASQLYRSITVENIAFELNNNNINNTSHIRTEQHVEERTILLQDIQSNLPTIISAERNERRMQLSTSPPKSVFLTGASGFLGVYILDNLTKRNVKVICLIRSSPEKFYSRVSDYYGVHPNRDQIELVKGDISKPRFGLSESEFERLRESVDSIVHSAANVNWVLPYSALRHTNTLPIKTVMQLANANIPIHYVSSIACAEQGSCETLIPDLPQDPSSMGYGTSKWASEYILSRYVKQHKSLPPVFIYRPAHLVPISDDNHSELMGLNESDFVSVLISGCIKANIFPPYSSGSKLSGGSGAVEWTCVNTCSKLIVEGVMNQGQRNVPTEFNIFTSRSMSFDNLYQAIVLEGYPVEKCNDKKKWNEMIGSNSSPFGSISFTLIDGLKGSNLSKQYNSSNMKYLNKKEQILWPTVSVQTIRNWIKHLQNIKQIPMPK